MIYTQVKRLSGIAVCSPLARLHSKKQADDLHDSCWPTVVRRSLVVNARVSLAFAQGRPATCRS